MDLARQDAGLLQLVGGIEVEVVRWHHAADRCVHIGLDDPVDHRELVAQLAVSAGLVEHAQGVLPKAATHWENGVILREKLDVVRVMTDGGASQVARDLTQVGLHHLFHRSLGLGFLGQNYLADHRIHVGIRQFDANSESAFELFQVGCASDGSLAGANEEQLGADVLGAGFDGFLHVDRALAVFADVLLHLVNDYEGERKLAVAGEGLLDGLDHVATGYILHIRVQVVQCLDAGCRRCEEVGLGFNQSRVQTLRHVEVVQLFFPVMPPLLDIATHRVVNVLMFEPHDESCHWVLLWQSDRIEENAEQRHSS